MSVLLMKILWYRSSDPDTAINITDSVNMNIGRGLEIRNNTLTIILDNTATSFNSDGNILHRYIDNS